MSSPRPLNPDEPYYGWEIAEPDGDGLGNLQRQGGLTIYSECCADQFSESEEIELLTALAARHGYTLSTDD